MVAIVASVLLLALLLVSAICLAIGWGMAWRLAPEDRRRQRLRWLLGWFAKGVAVPAGIWAVMNFGVCWSLPPFMPQVQQALTLGRSFTAEFLLVTGIGLFVTSSYWAAATLGWTLREAVAGAEGESRQNLKGLCWTCAVGMLVPAALIVLLGGWPLAGVAALAILTPMAGYAPGLLRPKQLPPMYARAVARLKFGKYGEAEWEIIRQLEKHEDDFNGWLMLADLYANHFNDLAEAEQTVLEICEQPKTTPSQLSIALHRLADWHLHLANDPDAARRALQMVCDRLPGTHLARMAQLRQNQLPATAEELLERQAAKPIPLPALGEQLEAEAAAPVSEQDREQAARQANACVERLTHDPNNVAAREELARLFAQRLDQAERGIEQVMLLLNMPNQPEAKRAEWLGLIAAWQLKYRQDYQSGRKALERVIAEFPHSPQALAARRRIQLLDANARGAGQNANH